MTERGSQLNENRQGDFIILQQIDALRRENRFLKVGLILCLVLSSLPYLVGFQPKVIRADRIVTKMISFEGDDGAFVSIVRHPKDNGLLILDKSLLPVVFLGGDSNGGCLGIYNKNRKTGAMMHITLHGGGVCVYNNAGQPVAALDVVQNGGSVWVNNKDGKLAAVMGAPSDGGIIVVYDNDGKPVWSVP